MNPNKNKLDEMQAQKKNRIGDQMFLVLFIAILVNTWLYGMGVRWLESPSDIIVISFVCFFVYIARLIISGAYWGPKNNWRVTMGALIAITALNVFNAIMIFTSPESRRLNGVPAVMVITVSIVMVILVIIMFVKRAFDKAREKNADYENEEDE